MYIAEEEVAHAATARTWYKSRGGVGFLPRHQIDQPGPLVVYHLDFRFQLAILGQKIASTLGGV